MDFSDIIERYRNLKLVQRLLLCAALGSFYPIYNWYEEDSKLTEELGRAKDDLQAEKDKLRGMKAKLQKLPKLQDEKAEVERGLERAKRYLPDAIEIDEVLTKIGAMENEFKVKVSKIETVAPVDPKNRSGANVASGAMPPPPPPPPPPAGEGKGGNPVAAVSPDNEPSLYLEVPIKVSLSTDFNRAMLFYDAVVHQDRLVHLRDLSFVYDRLSQDHKAMLKAEATMILFKSNNSDVRPF